MFYAPVRRNQSRSLSTSFPFADSSFSRFFDTLGFDVKEDEKAWTLSLDLPGISREDLEVKVEDTIVRLQTRAEAKRQYKAAYELPESIDVDTTTAELKDGVLTLTLGKKTPVSNERSIEIK